MSQVDFNRGLAAGKSLATPVVPTTVVSYLNVLNGTTITNSGLNNHLDRWPHVFPQAVNWFKFRWHNWTLPSSSTGAASNTGNSFVINSAYAYYNGTRVALKSGGVPLAGQTVADGANIDCDPLHPSDFGLAGSAFPAGAVIWTTTDIALASGIMPVCGATVTGSTDLNSQLYGAVAQFYNPSNTTVTVTGTGTITTTGTAPSNSSYGLRPICIGQLTVACDVWGARGDSISFGYNDATPSLAGTGWFQRAMLQLQCPSFNMAITASGALAGTTDARVTACYAFITHATVLFGANDFGYSGTAKITLGTHQAHMQALASQLRAAGVKKVVVGALPPITTDTANTWAAEGTQSPATNWGPGGVADQYNQSLSTLGFDAVLPMNAARGATSKYIWRSNGTAGAAGVSADGVHPATFASKALAAENAPIMLSVMDATPISSKVKSQLQRGPYILVPSAAWSYNLLESDLLFCLDAEATSSVAQTSGAVTTWTDLISGLVLTASGTVTYSATSFNSTRPGITLDGSTGYLQATGIGGLPTGGPFEIWFLGTQTAGTGDSTYPLRTIIGWGGTGYDSIQLNRQLLGGVNRAVAQIGSGTTSATPTNSLVDFSGLCSVRAPVTGDDAAIEVNGQSNPWTCLATAFNTTRVRVGANVSASPSGLWLGQFNLIAVTNPLSESNRANMAALLASRR